MWNMRDSPCFGCVDRVAEPNCHGTCERYAEYVKEMDADRRAHVESRAAYLETCAYMNDKTARMWRRAGWKPGKER